MKRKAIRHVTLGALVTGLVPLTAAGAGAGPAGGSGGALCRSTFGDRGPAGERVVGEGPTGDPMSVTIGWEPGDWPDGLRQIVTCVSVDGHGVSALTMATVAPPNTGSLTLGLTLPPGEPGSLVCEQSVLVGSGAAEGRNRPTSPVCFKLRAADPPPPTRSGGRTSDGSPSPTSHPAAPAPPRPATPTRGTPARPPTPSPTAPVSAPAPRPGPTPDPASTPPARAAFEAGARAAVPAARAAGAAAPTRKAGPVVAATVAKAPTAALPAATGAPATGLVRTGVDHHIPLAGAGGLLAFGGVAILFGEPRRRSGRRFV